MSPASGTNAPGAIDSAGALPPLSDFPLQHAARNTPTPTHSRKNTAMRSYPRNSPEAAARIVALVLIADGHVCRSEFDVFERSGWTARTGTGIRRLAPHRPDTLRRPADGRPRQRFDAGRVDDSALASLMAEVDEPALQRKVLRLAVAAARADRHLADGETLVLAAARRHWGISGGSRGRKPVRCRTRRRRERKRSGARRGDDLQHQRVMLPAA